MADDLPLLHGASPTDLNGVSRRAGPNPRFAPQGRYHPFDGDGMVHAAPFKHGKLISGEMMFVDYGTDAPYLHDGVVGADGQPRHHVPITLPGPRLPHDMAITRRWTSSTRGI